MSDRRYSFPLQNVVIKSQYPELVAGQTLDHIASGTKFLLSNTYWWFIMVNSRGVHDMSRWTVGAHQSRGHTQGTIAIDWFADGCWKEVYSHDAKGQRISGSLYLLTSAILSGRRVRFQVPTWNY